MTAVLYGAPGTFETQKPRAVPVSTPAEVTQVRARRPHPLSTCNLTKVEAQIRRMT